MENDALRVLKGQLEEQQKENDRLKELLAKYTVPAVVTDCGEKVHVPHDAESLDNPSIARYSRQLILPEIGVQGQLLLKKTSVLIVGCGGLGCPAAIYLTAAGIGCIGLVDHDVVEISNLHRQILHTESRVNLAKSASVAASCQQLNSTVECVPYHVALDSSNALAIISQYDIVLDATDNVATRYLLNDACVLAGKPLVSGSALRFEGQLTVYNHDGGPCYRCLFPKPPPPETVTNCSDGGVLGVVPGIIGSLQALEAIKIAAHLGTTISRRLMLFDALDGSFRNIKLRPKQAQCVVCGTNPTITQLIDYEQFCGTKATDKDKSLSVLSSGDRISVQDYQRVVESKCGHVLIDVRQPVELDICKLPHTTNIPMSKLHTDSYIESLKCKLTDTDSNHGNTLPVYVVCRRGNDSQQAVNILREKLTDLPGLDIKDITGGLTSWARHIDSTFPTY